LHKPRLNPQSLFERRWSGTHPFRPRVTRRRRFLTLLFLIFLCALIGAYAYVTDSARVRNLAEKYLSDVLGGQVRVESATLSIFEGLKLNDVRVYVDKDQGPDAVVFSAKTFRVNYDLPALLGGRLEAGQIVAIRPHVRLVQDLDTGHWNYQRLAHEPPKPNATQPASGRPNVLPEIILRDGQFENGELRAGDYHRLGAVSFEGRLAPVGSDGRYHFTLQSRTEGAVAVGPDLSGWVVPRTGQVQLKLRDVDFGPKLRGMLPQQVQNWCEQHQLAGKLTIHDLAFTPGHPGHTPTFKVRMEVTDVTLAVRAEEWRSREENVAVAQLQQSLALARSLGVGPGSVLQTLTEFTDAPPVRLHNVDGMFEFTDSDGIRVERLKGKLEENAFHIQGEIKNYAADAEAHLRFFSPPGQVVQLPHDPQYIRSLPVPIQEVYDRFKPEGACTLDFRVDRPANGAKLEIGGHIDVVDARFMFDRFPYPLRHATGRIVIQKNDLGQDMLEIQNLTGRGIPGTPNEHASCVIAGTVGPFDRKCEVRVTIKGIGVTSDPTVVAAMPRETQDALKLFDAPGKGEYPKFHGNFLTTVLRSADTRWKFDVVTDLDIDHCSGRLVVFPYPMDDVTVRLKIHETYLDIVNARMQRGDASLSLDGRVAWGRDAAADGTTVPGSRVKMRPDLKVTARNVPIDQQLVDALPPARGKWLRAAGLTGLADVDGRVFLDDHAEVGLDLSIALRDGKILPGPDGAYAVEGLAGTSRLTPNKFEVLQLTGRRGDATLTGSGHATWLDEKPAFAFVGAAKNLLLDPALYKLLPPAARTAWDQVHPDGTVDADVRYSGKTVSTTQPVAAQAVASVDADTASPADASEMTHAFDLSLRPRQLAVTPDAVPYRLDHLTGSATFAAGKVTLADITGRHNGATVRISGTGTVDASPNLWDLKIRGENVPADADLTRAAPKALADLLASLELNGSLNFDFTKLLVRTPETPAATGANRQSAIGNPKSEPASDIDFAVALSTPGASMSLALPVTDAVGQVDLAGALRNGALDELTGQFNFASLKLAGRPANNFSAAMNKPAADPTLHLTDLRGDVAGGAIAGSVDLSFPDAGPSGYNLSLVLRNANVRDLAPDNDRDIQGQLTASIALEGAWADPTTRRGRGDVLVTGREMYKVPVAMGFLQITNLSLPISQPFNEATARYSVQGQAVTFESVELHAPSMTMSGSGVLDFASKKVRMTFMTDNPNWPKLPFIDPLLQGARRELLQIKITGSIQDPKVSAGMFGTVTTTIDEVVGKQR
jgi:hypothetical protein